MLDIVFCSIPYSNLDHIYSAPAILKGIVENAGFKAKTKDFGLDLFELCQRDFSKFVKIQSYYISPGNSLNDEDQKILEKFYNQICKFVEENPAKIYSFSILSVYTHKSAFEILSQLRASHPTQKLLIGGRGATVGVYQTVAQDLQLRGQEKISSYGNFLKKRQLVNYFILGDGEEAVLSLLKGNVLEAKKYKSETLEYPLPNYDDYEFEKYLNFQSISMPVTGSKGCVRNCDFCDIKFQFGKYRYRTGKNIATEMMFLAKKYGFRKFQFTDSLVNGGLGPFEETCAILADYNEKNPQKKITWNGQYICRPKEQVPERLYPLMAASGAHGLTIGAESGSDQVLSAMDKKTTVSALLHELEMFRKYGITCVLLTMVGHWAETHEDFIEHCKMFIKILPYVRSGTISAISLGVPMAILDKTPSQLNSDKNGIILSEFDGEAIWHNPNNLGNTYKERVMRRIVNQKLCEALGIPLISDLENLLPIKHYIENNYELINNFYEQII